MAEPARANMMAVRRFKTRNATRGQPDFLPSPRSRESTVFWAEERTRGSRIALLLGGPGVAVLTGLIVWTMVRNSQQFGGVLIGNMVQSGTDNTHSIAELLFRDFLLPFEVTSVLILIAIMGAVVLAGRKEA